MSVTTTTQSTGLIPQSLDQAAKLAELMARGKLVPNHLQASPGDCIMVIEQAMRWGMSPFAVAQSTSVIQGKLMFSGALVAAALQTSGLLASRLSYDYSGEGEGRQVKVSATVAGEREPRSLVVTLREARTNNKVWQTQPDQQLAYHGARVWARRYAPEVMLGVYSPEEMPDIPADITGPVITSTAEAAPAEPPRPTVKGWLDALEADLKAAATLAEVQAIEARDDVKRAREKLTNGAADRLADMLTDVQMRFDAVEV